jgi:hypothetical protein
VTVRRSLFTNDAARSKFLSHLMTARSQFVNIATCR